jgi:hypothetical protein
MAVHGGGMNRGSLVVLAKNDGNGPALGCDVPYFPGVRPSHAE